MVLYNVHSRSRSGCGRIDSCGGESLLKNIRLMAPIFAVGLLSALPAFSSTILLGLNGEAEVGTDYLSFGVYPAGGPYTPAPGSGTYEVAAPVANIFAANGVTAGEFGAITS